MTRFEPSLAAKANKALAVALVTAMPCVVSAQTPTFLFSTASGSGGMWVLNDANGHVSFCQPVVAAPGLPIGKCEAVGTVNPTPAGHTLQGSGSILWVISKSPSGEIFQCSFAPGPGTNRPLGCQRIASTVSLP
jgi:hypothetical protein